VIDCVIAPLLQDISTGPKIHFEIETLEHPVVYPDFEVTCMSIFKSLDLISSFMTHHHSPFKMKKSSDWFFF
jgi:hypothetical protein